MKKIAIIFLILIIPISLYAQSYPIVELNILNTPNENGQVVIIKGESVEVEFIITDPHDELSENDILRLVNVNTGEIIVEKKKGHNGIGSISLNTNGSQGNPDLGEYIIQYVSNNDVITTVPDTETSSPIMIVADVVMQDIVNRIETLEQGGMDGKSAYEIWLEQGNTGTIDDFLASLKGEKGDTGDTGPQGPQGVDGAEGKSAYQIWLEAGNTGTEVEFLASLKGEKGYTGDTGPQGLQGEKGDKGDKGDPGEPGPSNLTCGHSRVYGSGRVYVGRAHQIVASLYYGTNTVPGGGWVEAQKHTIWTNHDDGTIYVSYPYTYPQGFDYCRYEPY